MMLFFRKIIVYLTKYVIITYKQDKAEKGKSGKKSSKL